MKSFLNNKKIWMCTVHLLGFSILFYIQVMCSHDPIMVAGPPIWLLACRLENLIFWTSILNIFTSRSRQSHLTNKSCALMIRSRVPARPYGRRCIGSSERAIPSPFSASSQLPSVPLFRGSDRGSKGPPHMAPMVAALTDGGEGVGDGQTWFLVLCFNIRITI